MIDTLNFIAKRYDLDLNQTGPIKINQSRWHDLIVLFKDLGFKKGAEVGVYRGRFSGFLCRGIPDLELYCIDAYEVYPEYREKAGSAAKADDLRKAFLEAEERTKGYNVKFIKALSLDAVNQFEDESLDFVYIDANHDFEFVVSDIAAWSKKVRKGGIVFGHDYFISAEHNHGVVEAVNGWVDAYQIKPLFVWMDNTPSWMYIK